MRNILLLIFFFAIFFEIAAEKTKNVTASIVFYPPENLTLEEAKRNAIERARIQAISEEFGTTVSQTNFTSISTENNNSELSFQSIGMSEVKGVWISDSKEPEISISYDGNMLVISATVWGKIREKNNTEVDLLIKTFCNGIESEKFKNNDYFDLEFQSPINGYLSVWLIDDRVQQSYCLVPYENENGIAREILNKKKYYLLSKNDSNYPYQEGTILTSSTERDINRLVIIFSSNKFVLPITDNGEYVPELPIIKFEKWLQKNRSRDVNMITVQKYLEILK